MPEPKSTEDTGADENKDAPQADQFGVVLNPDGLEAKPEEATDDKGGKEKTDEEKKADDIANHPSVVALNDKIKEYGENLVGQRQAHDKEVSELKQKLADALAGKKPEGGEAEAMFKDIKFSKDLSDEQKDDMTDTEIQLFDQNAGLQTAMNKMFDAISNQTKQSEEAKVEDLNSSANVEASNLAAEAIKINPELATDAKELTDKIIVEFNEFNNEGISPDKLVERMKKALNNVSGYTPPKEQEKKPSGKNPVKSGSAGAGDPHGIDGIVASVNTDNKGEYNL